MTNKGRNVIIIAIISGTLLFFYTRDKKLFARSKEDKPTDAPATSDQSKANDLENAKNSAAALKLAVNDGAEADELADLKKSVFDEYGLSMSMDADNNIIVKNVSGETIYTEPLV